MKSTVLIDVNTLIDRWDIYEPDVAFSIDNKGVKILSEHEKDKKINGGEC